MLFKLLFKHFNESKKLEYLRTNGVMLGTRVRNNRKIFLYMVKDFFVEVTYKNDSLNEAAEAMGIFTSLDGLNSHLEKEFRTAF